MSEDKLTPEEREAWTTLTAWMNNKAGLSSVAVQRTLAALDRLAPAPKPPEPRVSELPARWRKMGDMFSRECADKLDAALKRERERRRELRGKVRDRLMASVEGYTRLHDHASIERGVDAAMAMLALDDESP